MIHRPILYASATLLLYARRITDKNDKCRQRTYSEAVIKRITVDLTVNLLRHYIILLVYIITRLPYIILYAL